MFYQEIGTIVLILHVHPCPVFEILNIRAKNKELLSVLGGNTRRDVWELMCSPVRYPRYTISILFKERRRKRRLFCVMAQFLLFFSRPTSHEKSQIFRKIVVWFLFSWNKLTYELEQRFLIEINQYLNQHTTEKKVHNIQDVVQLFWTITKDSANKRKLNVLRNMHGLALHNEYVFSLLYPNNDAIPRLYGSCGLFYFMEQVPFTLNDVGATWSFRTSVARKLLDLVYRLDNSFHERLHVCDVKLDNFGIDNMSGQITILDADSVMINSVFEHKLAELHCVDDQDCSIGNCRGACDKNQGKCFPFRTNSNLQASCSLITHDTQWFQFR